MNNVRLVISGLPLDFYTITPEKYELIVPGETQTFTITFKADIEEKEYFIKFIVISDEGSEEVDATLNVKEKKKPLYLPLKSEISSQTIIVVILLILTLAVILWKQRGLEEQLQAMEKQIMKSRTEKDVKEDIAKIKKYKEKLNKKLEQLKEELKNK